MADRPGASLLKLQIPGPLRRSFVSVDNFDSN